VIGALDQLAETAGVSRRLVVNVEQGTTNPSVGTLLRISDALGVGLPALVESPDPDDSGARHCYGSDTITSSYTGRSRPKSLAAAIASLDDDQRSRYLNPLGTPLAVR
jgi:transcriptional regulator with XRE-family HTH domain